METMKEKNPNIGKSAFGLLSWFPDSENRTKLFYIGGLDQSYTERKSYDFLMFLYMTA